jgi:hypothetical protein
MIIRWRWMGCLIILNNDIVSSVVGLSWLAFSVIVLFTFSY